MPIAAMCAGTSSASCVFETTAKVNRSASLARIAGVSGRYWTPSFQCRMYVVTSARDSAAVGSRRSTLARNTRLNWSIENSR